MDIKKIPIEVLKALAYDNLVVLEQTQNNLKVINQEIAERSKKEQIKENKIKENKIK